MKLPYEINENPQNPAMKPEEPDKNLRVLVRNLQDHV